MGMDTIALIMEFEDVFKVAIPDEDAEKIQTVGQSVEYIVAALKRRRGGPSVGRCSSARHFYTVRHGLQLRFNVARSRVRPSTAVDTLIPPGARSRWKEFARQHGLPEPPASAFPSRRFPAKGVTLGQLIRSLDKGRFVRDGNVDADSVWETVCHIVAAQFGVAAESLHPDTHFINDLNAD